MNVMIKDNITVMRMLNVLTLMEASTVIAKMVTQEKGLMKLAKVPRALF